MITSNQFKLIFGYGSDDLTDALNETFERYNMNTNKREASFIAQAGHESGSLKIMQENLFYSAEGLLRVFPKYFNAATAAACAKKPEKIANIVYANRMGNGDAASGDGYRYRGRGAIQITGKNNYKALSTATGVDFLGQSDLLLTEPWNVVSAGWFWDNNGLNKLADSGDQPGICRRVNGGNHGLADRIARYNLALKVLESGV